MTSGTLSLTKKFSLYEAMIVRLFSSMPNGSLHMQWHDGHEMVFGSGHEVKANIRITNPAFFTKCVLYGDIGFAEAYMDGDWHTSSIADVITWFIINLNHNAALTGKGLKKYAANIFRVANRWYHSGRENTLDGSRKNIAEHYDLGNDFYSLFLDKTMTYSSAIFKSETDTLEEAQYEKYDRLCRLLKINANDHVLEIGSGWGGFAVHAAKYYGCKITTVTISQEQFNYARDRFEKEGLTEQIDIHIQDYRTLRGNFDKIVSIEMLEAVGHNYMPVYFQKCNELLKPGGTMGIQVITSRDKRYKEFRKDVDFIQKHIFPGSQTPSISAIQEAVNKVSEWNMYDLKDIGLDYARTLHLWFDAFNQQLAEVKRLGMNDHFIRKWNYYLQYCESAFRLKHITVVQLVYAKP